MRMVIKPFCNRLVKVLFLCVFTILITTNLSFAVTVTVDSLAGTVDNVNCNVPNPGPSCSCLDAVAGNCTWRSAINTIANSDGTSHTINFSGALSGTIDYPSCVTPTIRDISPDITNPVEPPPTITVNGNTNVTITNTNCSTSDALLAVAASVGSVTLNDMVFSGGVKDAANGPGTAIIYDGTDSLTCDNCSFLDNVNGLGGAGIYASPASTGDVSVVDSLFDNNNPGMNSNCPGCGIFFLGQGNLNCDNSVFNMNDAGGGDAGALVFNPASEMSLFTSTACVFTNNTATNASAAEVVNGISDISGGRFEGNSATGGDGGALVVSSSSEDVDITDVVFNMNHTGNMAGDNGGAIYIDGPDATVTISACEITNNTAHTHGGGIYAADSAMTTLIIQNSTLIDSNTATNGNAGGVFSSVNTTINHSTISNNKAQSDGNSGGGLRLVGGRTFDITNGTMISGNIVGQLSGPNDGNGGGIAVGGSSTVNITGSTISGNHAYGDTDASGGGIFMGAAASNLNITNSIISNNTALEGGGVFNMGEASIDPTSFSGNIAGYNSVALPGLGGAFHNTDTGVVTKWDCVTCSNNQAINVASQGGCIFNNGEMNITSSLFNGNHSGSGGAIYNFSSGYFYILNSTFTLNVANMSGGGIFNSNNGDVSFSTFVDNTAGTGGNNLVPGAMYLANSILKSQEANNNCLGPLAGMHDLGFNLTTDTMVPGDSCLICMNPNNICGVDPQLNTLGFYGGCINTIPPLLTSLVVNKIPPSNIKDVQMGVLTDTVTTDAIGLLRPPSGVTNASLGAREVGGDTATLTVVKDTVPDGDPTSFSFTVTGGNAAGAMGCTISSFNLADNGSNTCNTLIPGNYTITETPKAGYQTSISCDNATSSNNNTVNVSLAADDAVTCTVTNGGPVDLQVSVTGDCTVTSNPGSINCGMTCMGTFNFGTMVQLTATENGEDQFISWGGDCAGTDPMTTITMDGDKVCSAECGVPPSPTPTPSVSPTPTPTGGGGTVITEGLELITVPCPGSASSRDKCFQFNATNGAINNLNFGINIPESNEIASADILNNEGNCSIVASQSDTILARTLGQMAIFEDSQVVCNIPTLVNNAILKLNLCLDSNNPPTPVNVEATTSNFPGQDFVSLLLDQRNYAECSGHGCALAPASSNSNGTSLLPFLLIPAILIGRSFFRRKKK